MADRKCLFCGKVIGYGEWYSKVKKAIKPPSTPYRYEIIGIACEYCFKKENIIIDKYIK